MLLNFSSESERYFWSGKNINSTSCHCGRNNTCLDPEKPCNCDANVPEILSDKGFITAKEILPIRSVVYGPLSYKSQNANFTVGPLICTGKVKCVNARQFIRPIYFCQWKANSN